MDTNCGSYSMEIETLEYWFYDNGDNVNDDDDDNVDDDVWWPVMMNVLMILWYV